MAVRLTLILSGRAYEEHDYQTFKRIRIGRSEDCDLRIDNLGVSRYHCEIVDLGGAYQVRALSRNPTLVNGEKIKSLNINNGDAITLGKFTVAFSADQSWSTLTPNPSGGLVGQATIGDEEAIAQAREGSLRYVLGYLCQGEEDSEEGRRELKNPFFLFGKDEDCDEQVSGWGAPRVAAIVIREDNGFRLMDLSPKGDLVELNGKPCRDKRLSDGDAFKVKGQIWSFFSGAPGRPQ